LSQTIFKDGEIYENPLNISPKDMELLGRWNRIKVDCPWCLRNGSLTDFKMLIQGPIRKNKVMKKVSQNRVQCPECFVVMNFKTFMKTQEMSVKEYAIWFWDNVFAWGGWRRISDAARDRYFNRIKRWWYEDRNIYWSVYHRFKEGEKLSDFDLETKKEGKPELKAIEDFLGDVTDNGQL